MGDDVVRLEIAKIWKAFLGGLTMQIGVENQKGKTSPMVIEPLSINATIVHFQEQSLALFMDLGTGAGIWSQRENEQPLTEGSWTFVPDGVLIDESPDALAPLDAADSFVAMISSSKKRKN